MSRNTRTFVLMLAFGLAAWAIASGQAASGKPATEPAPVKVGIIAIQQAIAATNEGKKDLDALQQRFSPKQAEFKNLNDEIEKLKTQLQTQGDKLSDEAKGTMARNIDTRQKTLQRNVQDAQEEYQQAQQEIFSRIGGKMGPILEKYALKNGYGVILDVSNPQTPVLYASETTNITKEIVDAYNAQSPASPAPKASGAVTRPQPAAPGATAAKTGTPSSKRP